MSVVETVTSLIWARRVFLDAVSVLLGALSARVEAVKIQGQESIVEAI